MIKLSIGLEGVNIFMKVSENYIIDINYFMSNYLGVIYDGECKLTHIEMRMFLFNKDMVCPKRGVFDCIKREDILNGKYLLVRDESNKVIPYFNPITFKNIMMEMCRDSEELERRREALINKEIGGKMVGEADYIEYREKVSKRPKVRKLRMGIEN